MRKIIIIFFVLITVSSLGFTQNSAVIKELAGKVEIRQQGGAWSSARVGMEVPIGTVISTGFNSRARIEVGLSEIEIKPLTRMSIAEYSRSNTGATTSLDLKVGKVNAKVKSAEGVRHDFTLKSPSSTASVRGTEFTYDGYSVQVSEGTVRLTMNESGTWEVVLEGEFSGGEPVKLADFDVEPIPSAGEGSIPTIQAGAGTADTTGTLVVTFQ